MSDYQVKRPRPIKSVSLSREVLSVLKEQCDRERIPASRHIERLIWAEEQRAKSTQLDEKATSTPAQK